jgi:hypothetical protein
VDLNKELAYLAMWAFLDKQFSLGWKDLGGLLGSMSTLTDGTPMDQAFVADWQEAVEAALSGKVNTRVVLQQ